MRWQFHPNFPIFFDYNRKPIDVSISLFSSLECWTNAKFTFWEEIFNEIWSSHKMEVIIEDRFRRRATSNLEQWWIGVDRFARVEAGSSTGWQSYCAFQSGRWAHALTDHVTHWSGDRPVDRTLNIHQLQVIYWWINIEFHVERVLRALNHLSNMNDVFLNKFWYL